MDQVHVHMIDEPDDEASRDVLVCMALIGMPGVVLACVGGVLGVCNGLVLVLVDVPLLVHVRVSLTLLVCAGVVLMRVGSVPIVLRVFVLDLVLVPKLVLCRCQLLAPDLSFLFFLAPEHFFPGHSFFLEVKKEK